MNINDPSLRPEGLGVLRFVTSSAPFHAQEIGVLVADGQEIALLTRGDAGGWRMAVHSGDEIEIPVGEYWELDRLDGRASASDRRLLIRAAPGAGEQPSAQLVSWAKLVLLSSLSPDALPPRG